MKVVPSLCKVEKTLSIISGKWKSIILLHLLYGGGTKRFSELKQLIPSITQKMLTSQLRELEEQGLIRRIVHPQVPPKVEYSVTGYGETLKPVLFMMHEWGLAHLDRSEHDQLQQMPNLQVKS